jgi:hypothetical protein
MQTYAPSTCNNSASTGRIFMKFGIKSIIKKSVEKIHVSFKTDKNNVYFTCTRVHISDISLNVSDTSCKETQNTFHDQSIFFSKKHTVLEIM